MLVLVGAWKQWKCGGGGVNTMEMACWWRENNINVVLVLEENN